VRKQSEKTHSKFTVQEIRFSSVYVCLFVGTEYTNCHGNEA